MHRSLEALKGTWGRAGPGWGVKIGRSRYGLSVPYQHIIYIYIFAPFVAKGLKQLSECPMVHEFIFKHNNFHCDYLLQKAQLKPQLPKQKIQKHYSRKIIENETKVQKYAGN